MFSSRKHKNQMLSIGYKSDRFCCRGDSIGIFKPGQEGLEFVTEAKVSYPPGNAKSKGSDFKLSKMMLHQGMKRCC